MAKLFGDYSSWQNDSYTYFNEMKKAGSHGAMIKITEGIDFINPKAGNQVYNSWKVFGQFGCYHFFQGMPVRESKFFLNTLKKFGVDKSTMIALDVESNKLKKDTTDDVNKFLNAMWNSGYHNLSVYGSAYWFNSGRIKINKLVHDPKIWVASYGSTTSGVSKTDAWQFTDNWHGIDQSIDYTGAFTSELSITEEKPKYLEKGSYFQVKSDEISVYSDVHFKNKTGDTLQKGSKFHANVIKQGNIYRLKYLDTFGYVTANAAFVSKIK